MIKLKHFDLYIGKYTLTNPQDSSSILSENLEGTILGELFPEQEFSLAKIGEKMSEKHLFNHPEGHRLLFSNGTKAIFGDEQALKKIERILPDKKDRGAYGSLFIGECKGSQRLDNSLLPKYNQWGKYNILVVDDTNGENGNEIEPNLAFKLTGDCHGKINPKIAEELVGNSNHVMQHRLLFNKVAKPANIAKGTFVAHSLSAINRDREPDKQIDIIIPTSSFKGGEKPLPGLYQSQEIWVGVKELSNQGKIATSQIWASYPLGIKDILYEIEKKAEKLATRQKDPRELAKYYVQKYDDKIKNYQSEEEKTPIYLPVEYHLLKADIDKGNDNLHLKLLESPAVIQKLQEFVQEQWRELALAKAITFDRAMIIPSKELKDGEICVPWLPNNEQILNFRAPFLNSNGMDVAINKHLPEMFIDGKLLEGAILVSDETLERIKARLPEGEPIPPETVSQRQGRDFDGDYLGVALASRFPYLTQEAIARNSPEQRYKPIEKLDKISFPPEMSFEAISVQMSDGIPVGIINNSLTAISALESEIIVAQEYMSIEDRADLYRQTVNHLKSVEKIPEQHNKNVKLIVNNYEKNKAFLTDEKVNQGLNQIRKLYKELIDEAGFQNQIAVDLFKSNNKPDLEVIKANEKLLYRKPNYIKDKKEKGIYVNKCLSINGYSPQELIINTVNKQFVSNQLQSRPNQQFADLIQPNYTPEQYLDIQSAKKEFDDFHNLATKSRKLLEEEPGYQIAFKTVNGAEIKLTNLVKYGSLSPSQLAGQELTFLQDKSNKNRILAGYYPKNKDSKFTIVATISEESRNQLGLKAGDKYSVLSPKIAEQLTEYQIKSLYNQAYEKARNIRANKSPEELKQLANAAWEICNSDKDGGTINRFVFVAFESEISEFIKKNDFPFYGVNGLAYGDLSALKVNNQDVTLEVKSFVDNNGNKAKGWFDLSGQRLGSTHESYPQLPLGSKLKAKFQVAQAATASLAIDKLGNIHLGKIANSDFPNQQWLGENVQVQVREVELDKPVIKVTINNCDYNLGTPSKETEELFNNYLVTQKEHNSFTKFSGNSLKFEGEGYATFIDFTTLKNKSIKFVQIDEKFKNKAAQQELENAVAQQSNQKLVFTYQRKKVVEKQVFLQDEQGNFTKSIGTLTKANDQEKLTNGTILQGVISSNFTTGKLIPSEIVLPEKWQYLEEGKRQEAIGNILASDWQVTIDNIVNQIKSLPSLVSVYQQEQRDYWDLIVDNRAAADLDALLMSKNISYQIGDKQLYNSEAKLGYTVFKINPIEVSPLLEQSLNNKFNFTYFDGNVKDINSTSKYHQYLGNLPPNLPALATEVKITSPLSDYLKASEYLIEDQETLLYVPSDNLEEKLEDFQALNPSTNINLVISFNSFPVKINEKSYTPLSLSEQEEKEKNEFLKLILEDLKTNPVSNLEIYNKEEWELRLEELNTGIVNQEFRKKVIGNSSEVQDQKKVQYSEANTIAHCLLPIASSITSPKELVIVTDGACSKRNSSSALVVMADPDFSASQNNIICEAFINEHLPTSTVNRAELTAISLALDYLKNSKNIPEKVTIATDSEYALKILNKINNPRTNLDLINPILESLSNLKKEGFKIEIVHVNAHVLNPSNIYEYGNHLADALACAAKFTQLPAQYASNSEDIIKNRELLIKTVKDLSINYSKINTLNSLKYPEFLPTTNKRSEVIPQEEQLEAKPIPSSIEEESQAFNYNYRKHCLTEKESGKSKFNLNGKRPPLSPEILNKIEGQRMVNELAETLYAFATVNGDCFQDDNYQIRFDLNNNLLTITNRESQQINLAASYNPNNKIWYYRPEKVDNMLSLSQFNSLKQKDSYFLYSVSISSYYDDFNKKRNIRNEVIRQESEVRSLKTEITL